MNDYQDDNEGLRETLEEVQQRHAEEVDYQYALATDK